MTLWEHPEDLGMNPRGCPASVWQLQQVRKAYAEFPFITAAGFQGQFEGVDYPKPTRILTDIVGLCASATQAGRPSTRTAGTWALCQIGAAIIMGPK